MEKKYQFTLIVVALAAIGAVFLWPGMSVPNQPVAPNTLLTSDVHAEEAAGDKTSIGRSHSPLIQTAHQPTASSNAEEQSLVKRYQAWGARSLDDVRWLQQNGYPDPESADKYMRMTDGVLQSLAKQGDQLAAITLAVHQGGSTMDKQPITDLFAIAAQGSIFALETLGTVTANRPDHNLIAAQGYYEAARLRGNYNAPILSDESLTHQRLDPLQAGLSMQFSRILMDRLTAIRQQQGLGPLPYQPRPITVQQFQDSYNLYNLYNAEMLRIHGSGIQSPTSVGSNPPRR